MLFTSTGSPACSAPCLPCPGFQPQTPSAPTGFCWPGDSSAVQPVPKRLSCPGTLYGLEVLAVWWPHLQWGPVSQSCLAVEGNQISLSLSLFFIIFFPLLHSSPPESTKGLKPVEACLSSEFLWCSFKIQVFRTQKIISNLPEGSFYVVLLFMHYFMKWQSYHWFVIIQNYCWNILLFYVI